MHTFVMVGSNKRFMRELCSYCTQFKYKIIEIPVLTEAAYLPSVLEPSLKF